MYSLQSLIGKSGIISIRFVVVTARGRSLPPLTYSIDEGIESNISRNCPLIRSIRAGPAPRYGTCTMLRPVSILMSSPETWPADPTHENLCAARRGLFKDIFFVECDGGHGDLKVPMMWAMGAWE